MTGAWFDVYVNYSVTKIGPGILYPYKGFTVT